MGIDSDLMVDQTSLNNLLCSICKELLLDARMIRGPTLGCQHLFCKNCIDIWFDSNKETKDGAIVSSCPVCRETFSEKDITQLQLYQKIKNLLKK